MEERSLDEINVKLNKIIEGLYGSLDEPGGGFINKTNTALFCLTTKVESLNEDKQKRCDNSKWTLRMVLGTLFATIIAIVKAFFFDSTGN